MTKHEKMMTDLIEEVMASKAFTEVPFELLYRMWNGVDGEDAPSELVALHCLAGLMLVLRGMVDGEG